MYYVAKVTSFGCSSIEAVHQLQQVRSDQKALTVKPNLAAKQPVERSVPYFTSTGCHVAAFRRDE